MRFLCYLFAYLLSSCSLPSHAATAVDLLSGVSWSLVTPSPADAALETVAGNGGDPHGPVDRITVHTAVNPYYQIQLTHPILSDVPGGTRIRFQFRGRSDTSNPVRVVVEQAQAPYRRALDAETHLSPVWHEFTYMTSVPAYGPNGLGARFQVGEKAGVIELADIIVQQLGPDPAIAQAQAAITPAAIQARIRRYRMADLTVIVHDSKGRTVPQAAVTVSQTRHAFLFGCNIFGLRPGDSSPQQTAYQTRFAALFNYATLPFYWGTFEPTPGKPDYARLDAMAHWCIDHGISPKGHPLVWHQVYPTWAPADPDSTVPLLHRRVTDLVTHYKGTIKYWDVVNEANSPDPKTGEGAWIARDGPATVVGTALSWARAAGLGAPETFTYNDFDTGENNLALLSQLQQKHQLPDVIGLQSHMHSGVWSMADVWNRCQSFRRYGRPIHFTETTVVSGPAPGPIDMFKHYDNWVTTPAGEAAQADYVVKFYTLLFSHPALRAITWWDLSDQDAWLGAPAGLLRADMSPKPAYDRLMTLIHQTWWTDAAGQTDRAGHFKVHAFYGDYHITVTDAHGHHTATVFAWPEASGPRQVIVTLP